MMKTKRMMKWGGEIKIEKQLDDKYICERKR